MNLFHVFVAVWLLALDELTGPSSVSGLDNGLALTPPMGWLSWERFVCQVDCKQNPDSCISENLYKSMADVMASEGYLDVGYNLVNIDDCWMAEERDFDGTLQANFSRFPHGIKALADYVHSKGLRLGIYQDCGSKTCGGYPGSENFFQKDAQTFADWGVDMLKLDGCYANESLMDQIYPEMTQALNQSGRPIIFSCSWPAYQFSSRKPDYRKIAHNCNLWRNFNDIQDSWASVTGVMDYYAEHQDDFIPFSGPGAWTDPDMLMIGNFGLSVPQAEAQMAIWAILAAPLFMSTDLRSIQPEFKKILLNIDVIRVNQDAYGIMGRRIFNKNNIQIWIRPIGPKATDGSMSAAIAILNRGTMGSPKLVNVSLSSIGMNFEGGYRFDDLFKDQVQNRTLLPTGFLAVRVPPSGVVMLEAIVLDVSQQPKPPSVTPADVSTTNVFDASKADSLLHKSRFHMSSMGYGPMEPPRKRRPVKHLSEVGHDAYSPA